MHLRYLRPQILIIFACFCIVCRLNSLKRASHRLVYCRVAGQGLNALQMREKMQSEVATKIKAAIQAKINELGACLDEELPDYIMVLIANRKNKQQMTDDLKLFLGKSAPDFVEWSVLERFVCPQRRSKCPGSCKFSSACVR